MGDTRLHLLRRSTAILWAILLITICLQVIGTASHHHSIAEHSEHRRQERLHHQQEQQQQSHQSIEELKPNRPASLFNRKKQQSNSSKSSKLWLINSNPGPLYPQDNGWQFRAWHDRLTTTTTTTSTPRPRTPFPSLWSYASRRGMPRNNSTTTTRELTLSPRHGRHVCVENRTTTTTVLQPCTSSNNQICDDLRQRRKPANGNNIVYKCCPGWEQMYKTSKGCNRPICNGSCRNGGKCVRPNVCECPKGWSGSLCHECAKGWTGQKCQDDVNECAKKPCDQHCMNTPGSFYCSCRDGFQLQEDRTSCKRMDTNHVALEASELNGEDIDMDEIDHRLKRLERNLGPENSHQVMNRQLEKLISRVNQLEQYQSSTADRLTAMEGHAKKTDSLIDYLFRCRQYPHLC